MALFEDEDDLEFMVDMNDKHGEYMHACPYCETDAYLMDLE